MYKPGDIRRTVETRLQALGVSRDVRAQLLSHGRTSGVQARHYERYDFLREKSDALRLWELHLLGVTSPSGAATAAKQASAVRRSDDRASLADPVLTTHAADFAGVSRPYIVARIEAGDIALHQQVGNQRRILRSAVAAWLKCERAKQRRALGKLGDEFDAEIYAR